MEKELCKVLKIDPQGPKEKREDFLVHVIDKCFEMTDAQWNKLDTATQLWVQNAQNAYNEPKKYGDIKDFPADDDEAPPARTARRAAPVDADDDAPPPRARREEPADDEEAPPRRSRRDDPPEDEAPPPRRARREEPEEEASDEPPPRRARREEPEAEVEDEPAPPRRGRREEPEDEPAPPRRARREEPEEEAPPPRTRRTAEPADEPAEETLPAQVKSKIKTLLFEDPSLSPDAIIKALKSKSTVSKVLVADIKTEWRHTMKLAQDAKLLKKPLF